MKKWLLLFVAGAIVVGCSGGTGLAGTTGGAGGTAGGTGTTGTPPRSVPTITLATTYTDARIVFLSGQGRRSPGSQYAKLNNIRFTNAATDQIPTTFNGSLDGTNLKLDGYSVTKFGFTQDPFAATSLLYSNLNIEVWNMYEEAVNGIRNEVFSGAFPIPAIPVRMPLVPGRQLTIQMYLNDASLYHDPVNDVVFDQAVFNTENGLDTNPYLQAFFSDMVSFPLTGVTNKPLMASGGTADKFMVSGDAKGIARGVGGAGSFDLFSPNFVESGVLTNPVPLPDGTLPGSYTVLEPDPSVIPPTIVNISALQGSWHDYAEMISNVGSQALIIFPTTNANGLHTAVMIKRSGSTITDLWFGRATLNNGNTPGTLELWSVDQVTAGTENNKATGVLTNVTFADSVLKDGDYTIASPPAGFPFTASGTFAVFR